MERTIKHCSLSQIPEYDNTYEFRFSIGEDDDEQNISTNLNERDVRTLTEIFENVWFTRCLHYKTQEEQVDYLLDLISNITEEDDGLKQRVKEYFTNK